MPRVIAIIILFVLGAGTARAQDDGFKPMFNGKDLAGWHNVNCAPGTFFVKDDMIITTGKPTGYLRTDRHYENFIAEFDWFHAPEPKGSVGNSGFFVWCDPIPAKGTGYTRGIEVQVLVNLLYKDKKTGLPTATSYGDLFSIWGATCKPDRPHPTGAERCIPSENNCKGEFEWNHYKVIANDGVIKLHVNGKEVSGVSQCNPRKGYLGLESEGSECRFKNLKIKELPSTNPKPSEICDVDKGWKCLFTGLDLSGWKATDDRKAHWTMKDGVLSYDGKGKGESARLPTEKSYGDFEMVLDWKTSGAGVTVHNSKFEWNAPKNKEWNRVVIRSQGDRLRVTHNGNPGTDLKQQAGLPDVPIGLVSSGPAQFRNVFVRELKPGE
jgi:hypothetical protein